MMLLQSCLPGLSLFNTPSEYRLKNVLYSAGSTPGFKVRHTMALKADVRLKNKLYDSLSTIAGNPDFEYVSMRAHFWIIKPKYFWVQEINT